MKSLSFSVIILTYNEELNLPGCLSSLDGLCDDIHVVDSFSADNTETIARAAGASWYQRKFLNYADQRNWAIDNIQLKHDWVLHMDAGERMSAEMRSFLQSLSEDCPYNGIMFSRRILFLERHLKYGGIYPNYHLRLFRKGKGRCENKLYDQHFIAPEPLLRAPAGADLIDTLCENLKDFTERHLRWAIKEAEYLMQKNDTSDQVVPRFFGTPIERRRWWKRNVFEKAPAFVRPFAFFIYRYIFKLGFLDGKPGLLYHVLQGFWFRFLIDSIMLDARVNGREFFEKNYLGRK